MKRIDAPTYKRFITGPLKRFDERNTGYSRADRGELPGPGDTIKHGFETKGLKNIHGYSQEDYALNRAARTIDTLVRKTMFSRENTVSRWRIEGYRMPVSDPVLMSEKVKKVARWFGADLVGICELNRLWVYANWGEHNAQLSEMASPGDELEIPLEYKYAVVMVFEEDYEEVRRSPAVVAAYSLAYSQQAFTAASLAEFIRALGYRAIPSGNDMALSIPLAIDAGLGELGRNGLLIAAKYGPRVRISKVFTDLPLHADRPIDMGVQHFCEVCEKCAEHCPGGAILRGKRTDQPRDVSTNPNVLKWPIDAEKCLKAQFRSGAGCGNCIRVCPWNKPKGLLHKYVRSIIATTGLFDRFFTRVDGILGYGKQVVEDVP